MSNNGHRKALHFTQPPQRVVSLVPSLTESLFDLGFGAAVVGVTDYCSPPAASSQNLARVGGPKEPRIEDILALHPDLVLADQDENPPSVVESLDAQGVPVWVTLPKTVREAVDILWKLVELFRSQGASIRVQTLEMALDWTESSGASQTGFRYFCPLWQDELDGTPWWVTFNQDTYMNDLLHLMGGENVFAGRLRRYPLEADLGRGEAEPPEGRDTRYPRVTLDEVRAAQPEVILLPNEPFAFDERHRQELLAWLPDSPAAKNGRALLLDGRLLTWHGTHLAKALRDLPSILRL